MRPSAATAMPCSATASISNLPLTAAPRLMAAAHCGQYPAVVLDHIPWFFRVYWGPSFSPAGWTLGEHRPRDLAGRSLFQARPDLPGAFPCAAGRAAFVVGDLPLQVRLVHRPHPQLDKPRAALGPARVVTPDLAWSVFVTKPVCACIVPEQRAAGFGDGWSAMAF